MVNKKGVEIVHCVCLSCCFDMGLFMSWDKRYPSAVLDDTIITYNDI